MVQQQGSHFITRAQRFIEVNGIFDNYLHAAGAAIETTLFNKKTKTYS